GHQRPRLLGRAGREHPWAAAWPRGRARGRDGRPPSRRPHPLDGPGPRAALRRHRGHARHRHRGDARRAAPAGGAHRRVLRAAVLRRRGVARRRLPPRGHPSRLPRALSRRPAAPDGLTAARLLRSPRRGGAACGAGGGAADPCRRHATDARGGGTRVGRASRDRGALGGQPARAPGHAVAPGRRVRLCARRGAARTRPRAARRDASARPSPRAVARRRRALALARALLGGGGGPARIRERGACHDRRHPTRRAGGWRQHGVLPRRRLEACPPHDERARPGSARGSPPGEGGARSGGNPQPGEGWRVMAAQAPRAQVPLGRIILLGSGLVALVLLGRVAGAALPRFAAAVERSGVWGPVVFVLGYALATVAFVPGSLLTLAAGAIFGLAKGTVYVLVAATLGAS